MAKAIKGKRYNLAIVKKNTQFALAYAPREENLYCGDMVELENGLIATCILVDDYIDGEDVIEYENVSGMEAQRIKCKYRRSTVDWLEENSGDGDE